jgi:hypothetical protein
MFRECRHIKAGGRKCEAPALKGMPYCYFHDRLHRAIHQKKSAPIASFDLPPVEDRASVQIALSQVVRALAAGRMDPHRAGRMIYDLQVALQFAPTTFNYAASDSVQSLTRSEDGDDLAPEEFNCSESDSCQACPYYDECDHPVIGDKEDEEEGDDEDSDDDDEDNDEENEDDEDEPGTAELINDLKYIQSIEKQLQAEK